MKRILTYSIILLLLTPAACKKETPPEPVQELSPAESQLVGVASNFLPSTLVSSLKTDLVNNRGESNYGTYLNALNSSASRLDSILSRLSLNKAAQPSDIHNSLRDAIDELRTRFQQTYGTIECGLSKLGLGYGKGVELDLGVAGGIGAAVSASLGAHGGGGVEVVWDFQHMQRAVFPFSVCGVNASLSTGLSAAVSASLGFDGYVDWIWNFTVTGDITAFKGPGKGFQVGLAGSGGIIPAHLGIGVNFGYSISNNTSCNFASVINCPTFFIDPTDPTGTRGFTFGFSGEIGSEAGAELSLGIQGSLIGTCVLDPFASTSYHPPVPVASQRLRRWYAAISMAQEILGTRPVAGIQTNVLLNPFFPSASFGPDIFAAAASFLYASIIPSNCGTTIADGLVAYYPFNGNANDESRNGKNGTPVNSPTYGTGRSASSGSALQLNGINQYVSLPSSISITNEISISFWMKTNLSDNASWPSGTFIVDRDLCNPLRDWSVGLGSGGKLQFNTGKVGTDYVLTSTTNVNDDNWNHIVVVRDTMNQIKRIYINGQLNTSVSFYKQAFANNSINIYVGASVCETSTHHYYKGLIDDLRLYNRVLTEAEIQQLYNER